MSAQPNDRSAGQRSSDFTVPEFGPMDLFSEIDSTEKIGREMDRQLRSRNDTREVVRRQGSGGAVSYKAQDQAGGVEIARAALGGDILSYTDTVSSRRNIRTNTQMYSGRSDNSHMTSYTRFVNVATVDRPVLPYSETGWKHRDDISYDSTQFEVQEASVVPARAGISMLMFDMCCAKSRQHPPPGSGKKRRDQRAREMGAQPEWVDPERIRGGGGGGRSWDPQRDAHLQVAAARPSMDPLPPPPHVDYARMEADASVSHSSTGAHWLNTPSGVYEPGGSWGGGGAVGGGAEGTRRGGRVGSYSASALAAAAERRRQQAHGAAEAGAPAGGGRVAGWT